MVYASEQKRKDITAQREEWQEQQKTMDRNHLVFLDESGVNLNMTRRYGRAIGKARVYDYVPCSWYASPNPYYGRHQSRL